MYTFLFLAVVSLTICLALTPLCRYLRAGLVDRPDQGRKIHLRSVPRIGTPSSSPTGILRAPLLTSSSVGVTLDSLPMIWKLFPAFGLIFATGLVDDLVGLSWQKPGQTPRLGRLLGRRPGARHRRIPTASCGAFLDRGVAGDLRQRVQPSTEWTAWPRASACSPR